MEARSARQRLMARWAALKNERSSWFSHWQELSEYLEPVRGRFLAEDRNKGDKRNQQLINGVAPRAVRVLAAGMMAGITSRSRPWFRLSTPDPRLAESGAVREWLHVVEDLMVQTIGKSNLYECFQNTYQDLGQFGVNALLIDEDDEDVIRGYSYPVGMYALTVDYRGKVNGLYREVSMTVEQVVEMFGEDRISEATKALHRAGQLDTWVPVLHAIYPNKEYEPGKIGPKGMKFASCWMELNGDELTGMLRESGYEEMPFVAPRWSINGEDVYGHSPGMHALGDAKAVQHYEKVSAKAADKIIDPPMVGPTELEGRNVSLLPGAVTYVPANTMAGAQFRSAIDINPNSISVVSLKIQECVKRVNEAFFADLWLMMLENEGRVTATEVRVRHEEKMMQLGPVLERLQNEFLDPLIDRVFAILLRRGMLPPPPPELSDSNLQVEYISILHQAQKMLGVSAVERLVGTVLSMAAVIPNITDKLNAEEVVDDLADRYGVAPDIVRSDEQVAQIRQQRAQAQRAQMQVEQMAAGAKATKDLSQTSMEGDNALVRMVNSMGGSAGIA